MQALHFSTEVWPSTRTWCPPSCKPSSLWLSSPYCGPLLGETVVDTHASHCHTVDASVQAASHFVHVHSACQMCAHLGVQMGLQTSVVHLLQWPPQLSTFNLSSFERFEHVELQPEPHKACYSMSCCLSRLTFTRCVCRFGLAFADSPPGSAGIIGNPAQLGGLMYGVGAAPLTSLAATIPMTVFFVFQMTFASITPALIIGSIADR